MRILVTGGAGFMASNFIRHILHTYPDYEIINLDKLTYAGNLSNLTDIDQDPRYRFVKGDIADEAIVNELIPQVDAVINYAAETHVDRSIMEPKSFIMTDVLGTYTLLEACRVHGIQRYIQISTDEVYGSIDHGKFTEDSPFRPNSPYSASKAGGDHMVRAYYHTYGVPTIATHSCNYYGPYHYPEKLIPLFLTNLLEGKQVPLYGDGSQVREWIYTVDHCNAIDLILHKGAIGEEYLIGTGQEITNLELTHKLLALLDMGTEMIAHVQDRPGHDQRYAVDASKIQALGWSPQYSFDEGLAATVDWYRTHRPWWEAIKSGEYQEYYKQQYSSSL